MWVALDAMLRLLWEKVTKLFVGSLDSWLIQESYKLAATMGKRTFLRAGLITSMLLD